MELGEGVAVPGVPPKDKTVFKCDWTTCQKTHEKKPTYPKGGTVKHNSTYKTDWIAAKLEPWELHGPGRDSRASLADYRKETKAAKYAVTAAALKHPEYHTQKHHLLSIDFFKEVTKLSKNAKLVGYDVNHKNNGMCLPSYCSDIVQHDLQCHRGSHPKALYADEISPLLALQEEESLKYCELDIQGEMNLQSSLIYELDVLSARIEAKIRGWEWLLRKDAEQERKESWARYQSLK